MPGLRGSTPYSRFYSNKRHFLQQQTPLSISILQQQTPLSISIFEQADEAGVGMPYSDEENSKLMLANIASIEIPPIYCTYLEWLQKQEASHLQRYGVKKETLHDRQFLPRILLGEYFRDQFLRLVDQARQQKFAVAGL